MLKTIETHTCGHPTRVVVGGLPAFSGDSVAAQRACARADHDALRTLLCREPRGHEAMYAAYVVPSEVADVGVIFCSQVGYDDMCGHGTIGVVTALAAGGRLPRRSEVRLETPAGVVTARARWQGERVAAVTFDSVPAFVRHRDATVEVPGLGAVRGDIAFGGNWYLYLNAADVQQRIAPAAIPAMLRLGNRIKQTWNRSGRLEHPEQPQVADGLIGVSFYGPPRCRRDADQANLVVESATFYDRSPCGTGTCGRLAALHARGTLAVGAEFRNEGIAGGVFSARIVGETSVGGLPAVLPRLTGAAWIMGRAEWSLDPTDPLGSAGWVGSG